MNPSSVTSSMHCACISCATSSIYLSSLGRLSNMFNTSSIFEWIPLFYTYPSIHSTTVIIGRQNSVFPPNAVGLNASTEYFHYLVSLANVESRWKMSLPGLMPCAEPKCEQKCVTKDRFSRWQEMYLTQEDRKPRSHPSIMWEVQTYWEVNLVVVVVIIIITIIAINSFEVFVALISINSLQAIFITLALW